LLPGRGWEVTNDYSAVLSFQLFFSFLILGYAAQAPHLLESDEGTDVSHNRLAEGTYVPALHVSSQGQRRERGLKKNKAIQKLTGLEFFRNANTQKRVLHNRKMCFISCTQMIKNRAADLNWFVGSEERKVVYDRKNGA